MKSSRNGGNRKGQQLERGIVTIHVANTFSTCHSIFYLLIESVKQLDTDKVHIAGTAHQDDERQFAIHDQQQFVQHGVMLTNL